MPKKSLVFGILLIIIIVVSTFFAYQSQIADTKSQNKNHLTTDQTATTTEGQAASSTAGQLTPNNSSAQTTASSSASTSTQTVKLFYQNSLKAAEIGDVCSKESIEPVEREITLSKTPIKDTIALLIKGDLTAEEREEGFTTEFPNEKFKLTSAALTGGTLKLTFTEVSGFTSGGSCRVMLFANQIIQTAKQFPDVKNVIFSPDPLFQP